jgi:alcohol oxidase
VQLGRSTHGYDGPIKVSTGGHKLGACEEFIQVGKAYHKRSYADDTDDLETCNTYSVCVPNVLSCLRPLTRFP